MRSGGLEAPPGRVVAAAAEAMGGGLGAEEVRQIVRAAPTPAAAAPGLSVVAALTAQGLGSGQAVTIVVDALHSHRAVSDLLNLPSAARALQDEGMSPGEVGRRILDGGDGQGGVHSGGDGGGEPESGIPPGTGRGHEPHPPNPSHP
ncbi:MAG: hypothetical protein B7Z72_11225 [Gemmatimonadetes bacterium 21-71-4]|nr:MAG: hypothetical protein B7Z72_11225 [Gemmatimonadetes bacterium 21-71-4]